MPIQKITSRFDHRTLYECEAESLLAAITSAVKGGADLCGANLSGANLRNADLCGAYLGGANFCCANLGYADLCWANLGYADLCCANLDSANLRCANLGGADLRGAYLRGADIRDADLRMVKINWQSHDLIAELLRREANADINLRMVAGLVLVSRDWCWTQFLAIDDVRKQWAIDTLAKYVVDGDDAPEVLRD